MNLPSVKTLLKIEGMDKDRAKLLRRVLEANHSDKLSDMIDELRPTFATTNKWWTSCYGRPGIAQIKLTMANDLIEGHGVECSGEVDMRNGPPLEYVNLGDSYDTTLCRFQGRWRVASWGDIVERHERLFRDR